MKSSKLSKVVGASLLSLSLVTLPAVLPASAQTNTSPNSTDRTTDTTTDYNNNRQGVDYRTGDRDFDWGWLGLLGLIGLAGLARPKREEPVRYREPDEVSRPGARY
ncbi:WGxxGxxG family protein [Aerosakkonema funiforme]|uniref:WGxxGxxG-CTERM domain-containing protein n=1 Tax=Aerosakkonema funiforme FACHB-1375 TaxID=2949571 RepID=A0A926VJD6_9CYAN|nr:WGxxGxxG family protein [Aerosakkonema funiforme]MBD2184921.1 WGxxGxxG-CTERM domain-containing protein [Aerosakkonema funiforme FACHB-1375]